MVHESPERGAFIYKSQTCGTCPHLVLNVVCILSSFRFYHILLYHSEFIFTFSSLVVHIILQLHGGSPQEGRKLKAKLVTVD